jgi:hypothetical protein
MTKTWGTRSLAAAAVLGLTLLLGTMSAGAGQVALVINPNPVAAGQSFTVSGPADCITGSTLVIDITELSLTASVSGDDPWSVPFTVPADTPAGTYLVTVNGNECSYSDASLVVVDAATTTTTAPATTTTAVAVADATAAAPAFTG